MGGGGGGGRFSNEIDSSGEEVELTSGCSMEALGEGVETGVLKVVELGEILGTLPDLLGDEFERLGV